MINFIDFLYYKLIGQNVTPMVQILKLTNVLVKITEEVDSEDMGLVQPVTITGLDSISSLFRSGKLHEEISEQMRI